MSIEVKSETGFFSRTLASLRELWADMAGSEPVANLKPDLVGRDTESVRKQMIACLDGKGGEVSARQRAAGLGQAYLSLSREGRKRFLLLLATEFGTDPLAIDQAIDRLHLASDPAARATAEQGLREALTARRITLLTQFNALPQGVKFLVDMRADILSMLREEPALRPLDTDLQAMLTSWFDIGFLEMQSISWRSPASLLEKLIEYEAVHEIQSWQDLRNRLAPDRRLFAFFHPRMPEEPLIFVEVALVTGMAGNVQTLLDESAPTEDATQADTAIFYSISNTQKGLRGIGFGNFLIKRVVGELSKELPNLKTFATLSPIPGFRAWLDTALAEGRPNVLTADDRAKLKTAVGKTVSKGQLPKLIDDPAWRDDPALADALRDPMMRLCARYLAKERKRQMPLDPVARFHLTNGAQIERINWLGDRSDKGMIQSAGMMVNYLYRLSDIERNHEKLASDGTVAFSSQIKALL